MALAMSTSAPTGVPSASAKMFGGVPKFAQIVSVPSFIRGRAESPPEDESPFDEESAPVPAQPASVARARAVVKAAAVNRARGGNVFMPCSVREGIDFAEFDSL